MGLSHIEIHVSNVEASEKFYDLVMPHVGFGKYLKSPGVVGYSDGNQNLIFAEADIRFRHIGFHRKRVGLNHLAFRLASKAAVDKFYREVAMPNRLWVLYGGPQTYHEYHPEYYALYFEDPDRIKIEITYAPEGKGKHSAHHHGE